jgi:hypothetical protein
MGEPVIYIDSQKARDLDQDLALQKLYYRPEGKAPHEPSQLASWLELFKLSQAEPR